MEQLSSLHYPRQNEPYWFPPRKPNRMSSSFLLVGDNPGSPWATIVRSELSLLGDLEVVTAAEALERISKETTYRMVLVDAGTIEDMHSFIHVLRKVAPSVPIVVATASPTWQSAKEAFLNGADDYIRKYLDADALGAVLRDVLARSR